MAKADQAAEVRPAAPMVELFLMLDGTIDGYESFEDAVAAYDTAPLENRVAGTDMLYSSGTTGRPKGVLPEFTPTPMDEYGSGVEALLNLLFGMNDQKVYLSPAPLYHAAPLRFCMAVIASGSTVVVMEKFDPERYLELVQQYQVTHSQLVPTMFVRCLLYTSPSPRDKRQSRMPSSA